MCVYLRTKCKVSSIILTSFRQEGGRGVNFTPLPTSKRAPKKPTLIRGNANSGAHKFTHD